MLFMIMAAVISIFKRKLVKKVIAKVAKIMVFNGLIRSYQMSYVKLLVNSCQHILI